MDHKMGLFHEPFHSIKQAKKKVEVRLNDEKRRKIQIGDTITFSKLPEKDETIKVEVIHLTAYPTFKEMYEDIPASDFDVEDQSIEEMVESTYEIYTQEDEQKWGTLAIEIKLINIE